MPFIWLFFARNKQQIKECVHRYNWLAVFCTVNNKNGKWMVNGSRYYRGLESVSIASALSTALTIYPCQIRVHQRWLSKLRLPTARKEGCRPQWTVHPRRLPVNTVMHTTLVGLEPTTFRLLVRRATSSATDAPNLQLAHHKLPEVVKAYVYATMFTCVQWAQDY